MRKHNRVLIFHKTNDKMAAKIFSIQPVTGITKRYKNSDGTTFDDPVLFIVFYDEDADKKGRTTGISFEMICAGEIRDGFTLFDNQSGNFEGIVFDHEKGLENDKDRA